MSKIGDEFDDLKDDAKGKHGKDKRNTVIAIGTILLVVIAYLTLKRMGQGAADSAVTGSPTSGVTGDPGNPIDQSLTGVANAIGSQSGLLARLDKQLKALRKQNRRENKTIHHLETQLHKARHGHGGTGHGGNGPSGHGHGGKGKGGQGHGRNVFGVKPGGGWPHPPHKGAHTPKISQGPNPPRPGSGHGQHRPKVGPRHK